MTSAIVHIDNIHNNAYILAPIIESFYENAKNRKNNLLLSYLILPLIMHEESRTRILNSNVNSSIYTIFADSSRIYGINERTESYKEVTNKCILLSVMEKSIRIENDMSICFVEKRIDSVFCDQDKIKSAKKLAELFNSHEIIEIYRKLGIKKL